MISVSGKSTAIAFGAVGMATLGIIIGAAWIAAEAGQADSDRISEQAKTRAAAPQGDAEAPKADADADAGDDAADPQPEAPAGMMRGMMGGGQMGGMMGGQMMGNPFQQSANSLLYLEIAQLDAELTDKEEDGPNHEVLEALNEKAAMAFSKPTPLHFVLKYVKTTIAKSGKPAVPFYVDPVGLQEARRSLDSTVQADLEGVPLRTSLRLVLKQLGLAYCVRDGVLIISSARGVRDELAEQAARALVEDPDGLWQPTQQLLERLRQGQDAAGARNGMGMM